MKTIRFLIVILLLLLSTQTIFAGRYYDSETGRWLSVDPMADKYPGWSPYNYCLNNPLGNIDPDGKDVIVLNASEGSYGTFGHNGVLVGNDNDKWEYFSYDGDRKYSHAEFNTLSSFYESKISHRYDRSARLISTSEQDKKAKEQGNQELKVDRSDATVLTDNCADLVKKVAKKGGHTLDDDTVLGVTIPNKQYDEAKNKEKKQKKESYGDSQNGHYYKQGTMRDPWHNNP